jgi:catechol 2,3-dioxygenase-like lactoylglutathione lyase family enzyme
MKAHAIDHIVLTVRDVEETVSWYRRVLGLEPITFGEGRRALQCGSHKLNLHLAGAEVEPHAAAPTPGSADLCFVVDGRIEAVELHLSELGVPVELGPVDRTGAKGQLRSVYVRDPDGNLVEVSVHRL